MSHSVKVLADSISRHGRRITTYLLNYPMLIHWDLLTHRALSRNAESGRAISIPKKIKKLLANPFRPEVWMADATQMREGEELPRHRQAQADATWDFARNCAVHAAEILHALGVHREQANTLLIPFSHHSVVVTATDWDNFFALRVPKGARNEFRVLARDMAIAYRDGIPREVDHGEWHLPFVTEEERKVWAPMDAVKVSVARTARISFLKHDGNSAILEDEIAAHDRRLADCHWSPFESPATPSADPDERSGNFVGWIQYRQQLSKSVHTEFDFSTLDQWR